MNFSVIIPARYGSSRLPAKALLDIKGKPMIQWVFEAAQRSEAHRVVVATDDSRIADTVGAFGGKVVMTAIEHHSGTDRLQEAAQLLQLRDDEIVVNVQGDEPLIPHEVINQVAQNLKRNRWASLATLCEPMESADVFANPNVVKVVRADDGRALYFSRAPIPHQRDGALETSTALRHVGLYAYKVSFLNRFVSWPEHPLEAAEKLEQLRALANGEAIHIENSIVPIPVGVDTQEDLDAIRVNLEASQERED